MSSSSIGTADRRLGQRRPLRQAAELILPGNRLLPVRIHDVSLGGMSLIVPVNLPAQTGVRIRTSLPLKPAGRLPAELPATVQYSVLSSAGGGFQVGVNFGTLPEPVRAAIAAHVNG